MKKIFSLLMGTLLAFVLVSPVSAEPVHGRIALLQSDPHYGDYVQFVVSINNSPAQVRFSCIQNNVVVCTGFSQFIYNGSINYVTEPMNLSSGAWTGGEPIARLIWFLFGH